MARGIGGVGGLVAPAARGCVFKQRLTRYVSSDCDDATVSPAAIGSLDLRKVNSVMSENSALYFVRKVPPLNSPFVKEIVLL